MELTIDQALHKAVKAHKAGQIQEADRLYTAILKAQPKHPDANHNMGVLAVGVGKVEQALPFFMTALEANPATAQFWLSYIDALIKLDKLTDAKAVFDQAKSKGAKGDGFDKLEQRLKDAGESSALDIAVQLRDSGEFNQAIDLLKDATNQFPEDADILALLSHCYLLADQVEEAKLHLDRATTIAPHNASVGWNTARLTLKEQKPLEALNIARDNSQKFPDDVEGMGVLGACLRANGEADESLEILNRAIELNPDYAEALINRGLIRLSQENKPEALSDLELAHGLKPHIRQIWDLVVALKVEAQDYSEAIPLLINMIEIDPENEKRLATLALCYQHLKDFEAAIEAYRKALAIKPDNAEVYSNLGVTLQEQGKLDGAIEAYNKALAIKPDNAEAYNNMGNALKDQGKLEEAIEAYNKALAIKPDNAEAYHNLGVTLKDQGKLEEAIEAYNKALAIKPDYAEAYNNMGITLQDQGKLEEATEAYNKALAIKPDYAGAYSNMGVSLQEQGKLDEAIEACSKALAIKPDYAEAYHNLGNALKEQGKLEEAIDSYNKALAIKPDCAEAARNLVKLPIGSIDDKTLLKLNKQISIFSNCIKDQSQWLFFEANLLTHNGEYDKAFKGFVEANKVKVNEIASAVENLSQKYYKDVKRIQHWSPNPLNWNETSLKKLFLLGPSRSGKSSLENLLMRIPQIHPMYENINLNSLRKLNLGSRKATNLDMMEMFYHDEECLLNDGHRIVTSTSPQSVFHIDQLLDGCVNSLCVLVKRDQTDVASEIFTKEYRNQNFFSYSHSSIQEYLNTYSVIWEEIKRKTPQHTLEIEYEDILLKPQKVLDQISHFVRENLILENAEQYSTKKRISSFREHYAQRFKS